MTILWGFLSILWGVFLIYLGALQIIGAMLPQEYAYKIGEAHGRWVREKVLNLPSIPTESAGPCGPTAPDRERLKDWKGGPL